MVHTSTVNCSQDRCRNLLTQCIGTISERYENQHPKIIGIKTGYQTLDDLTNGLHKGQLTVIASRPAMGKTSLALNIATKIAMNDKNRVAFFSYGHTGDHLMMRMIASIANVSLQNLLTGKLDSKDWLAISHAISKIITLPIAFFNCANLDIFMLSKQVKNAKQKHDFSVIFIDYMQLIASSEQSIDYNENHLTIISTLKSLAKGSDVSIVLLSQLSRKVDQRSNKRPTLADFPGSCDADSVWFIYRDCFSSDESLSPFSEVIVSKQPNGITASIPFIVIDEYCRFQDLDIGNR